MPKKNIKLLGGYPLIAFSIVAANMAKKLDRVIVSTDSEEIADISKYYGAEVPFLRPSELARDDSPDIDFINHALNWLESNEGGSPDLLVQLRPTTPLREPEIMDLAIERFLGDPDATSLRSIHPAAEPAQKMLNMKNGYLCGIFPDDRRPEYYNMPRQAFPQSYIPNGYVDILKKNTIRKANELYGKRTIGFPAPNEGELDLPDDFDYIEYRFSKKTYKIVEYLNKNY